MAGTGGGAMKPVLLAGLLGSLAGAGSAYVVTSAGKPGEAPIAELRQGLDALHSEFKTLRDTAADVTELEALNSRLTALTEETATAASVSQLREQVLRLEETYRAEITSLRGAKAKTAAAALALREIDSAIHDGLAFAEALEQLRAIMDDDPILKELTSELAAYENGVLTLNALSQNLDTIRIDAIRARGQDDGSWVNRTVENLRALIDVEGLPELKGVDAVLGDARDKTKLNQLPAAIAGLEPLIGEVPALERWIGEARARQTASDLLRAIDRRLDELVSRQG